MYNIYKTTIRNKGQNQTDDIQEIEAMYETEKEANQTSQDKLGQVRQLLIESQTKWNNFSNKLLKISEDLYFLLEQTGAIENVNEQWLGEAVQKLNSYRNFLIKVGQERQAFQATNRDSASPYMFSGSQGQMNVEGSQEDLMLPPQQMTPYQQNRPPMGSGTFQPQPD